MNQLYLLGGSILAVLLLAGIARLLGLGGAALAGEAEARDTAEAMLPGFEPCGRAWLDRDRAGAVVEGADGVAVVRRHGARFVARRFALPVEAGAEGAMVVIASGERLLEPFVIALASEAEARELTSMLTSPRRA